MGTSISWVLGGTAPNAKITQQEWAPQGSLDKVGRHLQNCNWTKNEDIKSDNHLRWKRLLRSSPAVNPALLRLPLNHIPNWLIYMWFRPLHRQWVHHCLRQPVPMLDHPFSKESFPYSQFIPPFGQLEAIFSFYSLFLGEETDPYPQSTDQNMKPNLSQYRALGSPTRDWLPRGCHSAHLHSLGLAMQKAFQPGTQCTCPSHEQAVSPGEASGKQCQRLN